MKYSELVDSSATSSQVAENWIGPMPSEEKKESLEIQKIIIKGFKSIRVPLEINLAKPLTILVGDNGAGKTTILEAVQLACTGQYRGESIRRALSQSLFNKDDVESLLNSSGLNIKNIKEKLPSIKIEVFLTGGERHIVELFSGANNLTHAKQCGFSLTIAFDNAFIEELNGILDNGRLTSVPIEYYDATWMTFAGSVITPRKLPVHSVMMNPTGEWLGNRSDERAVRILIDGLTERQQMTLAKDARTAFDSWNNTGNIKAFSNFLPSFDAYDWGIIDLAVDSGTVDSWKRNIVVRLDSIPYGHIGSGRQSVMQASLALRKQRPEKTTMLLFEEPENHLSHANLNRLIRLIAERAEGRKVVVSTHSSFVANTLGLQNLQLIGSNAAGPKCLPLDRLDDQTLDFFKKLPGYDTLRLVLARAAILVEGPSDELIVQLAYRQKHNKLPIEEGIDVISVGSGFLRFLVLACAIGKPVLVLTDNDGDPGSLRKKYEDYREKPNVKISYDEQIYLPEDPIEDPNNIDSKRKKLNWNTLEAEMIRKNGRETVNSVLEKAYGDNYTLLSHMESNKTDTALRFFDSDKHIGIPDYIANGLTWLDKQLGDEQL
ncbi:MAG: AAA family ATPase [Aeriscardovia sp.]|nr:AAA family ATPase [Aeriscardovia sp.]